MAKKKNPVIEMHPAALQTSAGAETEQRLRPQSNTDERPERHEYADLPRETKPDGRPPVDEPPETEPKREPPRPATSGGPINVTAAPGGFRNKLKSACAHVRALPGWQQVALAGAVVAGGIGAFYLLQHIDQVFKIPAPASETATNVIPMPGGSLGDALGEALEDVA